MQRPILFHPRLGVGPKRLDVGRMVEYPTLARRAVARQLEHEMMAEELRLLYVAVTRAKDKLILSGGTHRGRKGHRPPRARRGLSRGAPGPGRVSVRWESGCCCPSWPGPTGRPSPGRGGEVPPSGDFRSGLGHPLPGRG